MENDKWQMTNPVRDPFGPICHLPSAIYHFSFWDQDLAGLTPLPLFY
jgi:hypothetical protein